MQREITVDVLLLKTARPVMVQQSEERTSRDRRRPSIRPVRGGNTPNEQLPGDRNAPPPAD